MPEVTKVIKVAQTSPGGKYTVRLSTPYSIKGKGLTKQEAGRLAGSCYMGLKRLGVRATISVV